MIWCPTETRVSYVAASQMNNCKLQRIAIDYGYLSSCYCGYLDLNIKVAASQFEWGRAIKRMFHSERGDFSIITQGSASDPPSSLFVVMGEWSIGQVLHVFFVHANCHSHFNAWHPNFELLFEIQQIRISNRFYVGVLSFIRYKYVSTS